MSNIRNFRQEGYQQGFIDGQRTCGKINSKYTDTLFKNKTHDLSTVDSCDFLIGWQDGFADGVIESSDRMLMKEEMEINILESRS